MVRVSAKPVFLVAALFVSVLWAGVVQATELYIPPANAKPGQTIDIPVMIDQVDNLAGVKLVMEYDAAILAFKKGAKTKQSDSLMHIINDRKPGKLIIVMAGARGIKGKDFPILLLTFAVKEGLKGNHNTRISIIEVQLMSDRLKDIECKTRTGPLTITSSPPAARGKVK